MNPLVSVIVPVYNVKQFVKKSIESLLNQTYNNLEIIIIDDGSSDGSSEILDDFLSNAQDKILLKRTSNQGLSNARNVGLSLARGEYILFLDGDDWLDTTAIEYLMDIVNRNENNIDLVLFPYVREFGKKSIKRHLFDVHYKFFNADEFNEVYKRLIGPYQHELSRPEELDIFSTAWGKLYSRSLIKHLFAPYEVAYPEDTLFNIKNLKYVNNAVYTEKTFMHYNRFVNNSSTATKTFNAEHYKYSNNFIQLLEDWISNHNLNNEYVDRLSARVILRLFSFILTLSLSSLSIKEKIKYGQQIVNDPINIKYFQKFKQYRSFLPLKWRCFYFLLSERQVLIIILSLSSLGKIRNKING